MAANGWASMASRAESSGWAFFRKPYSSNRPATCAGPTNAAAPMATTRAAPLACKSCGRWAAMAVLMNQDTANT
ncbi:hypothetical protein D3C71_1983990 [compost metagenome]